MLNTIEAIWLRLERHQNSPFLLPSGRDFHYEIVDDDGIRFSCHKAVVAKSVIEEALAHMPCDDFKKLPRGMNPRNAIWTLLSDTRIYQREKFAEYEPSEFWERRGAR